ncbi:MAG: hypothetical protein ABIQ10_10290, partial [Gemmatimonadaceae bacterium]
MMRTPNLEAKLELLMSLAGDDKEGLPTKQLPPRLRHVNDVGALRPLNLRPVRIGSSGPRTTLMRILMTNACSFNCHYCPMRRDRDMPRTLLKPAELVRIFLTERISTAIRGLADLRAMGVVTTRAAGFLTLGGRRLQT